MFEIIPFFECEESKGNKVRLLCRKELNMMKSS